MKKEHQEEEEEKEKKEEEEKREKPARQKKKPKRGEREKEGDENQIDRKTMAFTSAKVASVSKSVARTARRSVSCQAQQANREQKIVQRRQLFSLLAGTLGVAALGGKAEALPTVSLFLSFFFFFVCVCVCVRERERERENRCLRMPPPTV